VATPPKRPLRIYADTSVFGGCFDPPFAEGSERFFHWVRTGRVVIALSRVVKDELEGSPARVRDLLDSLPPEFLLDVPITAEVHALRDAYLAAGVIGRRSIQDATHVAAATLGRADAIVSWNFRHMVRLDRIRGYNAVNLQLGYAPVSILNPGEVLPR